MQVHPQTWLANSLEVGAWMGAAISGNELDAWAQLHVMAAYLQTRPGPTNSLVGAQ